MTRTLMVLLAAATLACSGTSGPNPPPPPPPPAGPPPPPPNPVQNAVVQVQNNFFNPETVAVFAGGTVRWDWVGQNHNVTSVLAPTFGPNSATVNAPFTHGPLTFNTAGTFRYICTVHGSVSGSSTSGMAGVVIVQ